MISEETNWYFLSTWLYQSWAFLRLSRILFIHQSPSPLYFLCQTISRILTLHKEKSTFKSSLLFGFYTKKGRSVYQRSNALFQSSGLRSQGCSWGPMFLLQILQSFMFQWFFLSIPLLSTPLRQSTSLKKSYNFTV